jgi:hypothetical protein
MSTDTDTDRITDKIAALLRLADGAATDGEREAALAHAAKLSAKHNINLQSLDAAPPDGFDERCLADFGAKPPWLDPVVFLLETYFFVAIYFMRRSGERSRLMIVGQKHNLAIAVHIYVFLSRSFAAGWRAFAKARGSRAGERSYYWGVYTALDRRLTAERQQHSQAEQAALIRVGRAADAALAKRHPDIKSSASAPLRSVDGQAFNAGFADGQALQIRKALRHADEERTLFLTSDL